MGPVSFAWLVSFELLIAFFTALNQYVAWSPVAEHTAKTLQTPVSEDVLPLFEDNRKVILELSVYCVNFRGFVCKVYV